MIDHQFRTINSYYNFGNSLEYTYRYGKVHLTFQKLKDVVTEVPQNIPNKGFTQPTQAMSDDCKSDCSLEDIINITESTKVDLQNGQTEKFHNL